MLPPLLLAIKHSPSKRKGNSTNRARTLSEIEHTDIIANTIAEEPGL